VQKTREIYLKFIYAVNKIVGYILFVLLAMMVTLTFFQVFNRFVLSSSISWSEEMSRYLMVWGVFLALGYASRKNKLVALKFISEMMPQGPRKLLQFIIQVGVVAFGLLLSIYGLEMTMSVTHQATPALEISKSLVYAAVPIGGVLTVLNSIAYLVDNQTVEKMGEMK